MCKSCGCGSKKSHRKPAKKAAPRKKAVKKVAKSYRKGK